MAIYSVEDLKTKLLDIEGAGKDSALSEFSAMASGWLQSICRQPIDQTTVTRYGQPAADYISLPYTVPVVITSVEGRDEHTDSWTAVTGTTLVTDHMGKQYLYNPSGYTYSYLKLTLSVGYAEGAAPAIVKAVFYQMVQELLQQSGFAAGENRAGVKQSSKSVGGVTATTVYDSNLRTWKQQLTAYTIGL